MYCKFCGKEISDDSKFCCYCGKQVFEEQFNSEVEQSKVENFSSSSVLPMEVAKTVNVNIQKKESTKKSAVANEIVANMKMTGCAILTLIVFVLGFYMYHNDDIKPMDDYSYFGESCYDHIMTGNWEFSWEKQYYKNISAILPYSQWDEFNKEMGIPKRGYSRDNLFIDVEPKQAIKMAEDEAKEKQIPKNIQEELINDAKENAKKHKEDFREIVTSIRKSGFEEERNEFLKWCTITSLSFFVLGRYVIKLFQWVCNNKTN